MLRLKFKNCGILLSLTINNTTANITLYNDKRNFILYNRGGGEVTRGQINTHNNHMGITKQNTKIEKMNDYKYVNK